MQAKIDERRNFVRRVDPSVNCAKWNLGNHRTFIEQWKHEVYLTVERFHDETFDVSPVIVMKNLAARALAEGSGSRYEDYQTNSNFNMAVHEATICDESVPRLGTYDQQLAVLKWATYISNRIEYAQKQTELEMEDAIFKDNGMCIPCTLHGENRIGKLQHPMGRLINLELFCIIFRF